MSGDGWLIRFAEGSAVFYACELGDVIGLTTSPEKAIPFQTKAAAERMLANNWGPNMHEIAAVVLRDEGRSVESSAELYRRLKPAKAEHEKGIGT